MEELLTLLVSEVKMLKSEIGQAEARMMLEDLGKNNTLQDENVEKNLCEKKINDLLEQKKNFENSVAVDRASLEKSLLEANKKIKDLEQNRISKCKSQCAKESNSALEKRNQKLESDLNDILDRELRKVFDAKNYDFDKRIDEMSTKVENDFRQSVEGLEQTINSREIIVVDEIVENVQSAAGVNSKQNRELKNQLAHLSVINSCLRSEREDLLAARCDVDVLLSEISNLKEQKVEMQAVISNLENEAAADKETIEKLHKHVCDVTKKYEEKFQKEIHEMASNFHPNCFECQEVAARVAEEESRAALREAELNERIMLLENLLSDRMDTGTGIQIESVESLNETQADEQAFLMVENLDMEMGIERMSEMVKETENECRQFVEDLEDNPYQEIVRNNENVENATEADKQDLLMAENLDMEIGIEEMSEMVREMENECRQSVEGLEDNPTSYQEIIGLQNNDNVENETIESATETNSGHNNELIEKLKCELASLNAVNFCLRNEREELLAAAESSDVDVLQLEISSLKEHEAEMQTVNDILESESAADKATIDKLHKQICDVSKRFEEKNKETASDKATIEKLQEEIRELTRKFEQNVQTSMLAVHRVKQEIVVFESNFNSKCSECTSVETRIENQVAEAESVAGLRETYLKGRVKLLENLLSSEINLRAELAETVNAKEVKYQELLQAQGRVSELELQIEKTSEGFQSGLNLFAERLLTLEGAVVNKLDATENRIAAVNRRLNRVRNASNARRKINKNGFFMRRAKLVSIKRKLQQGNISCSTPDGDSVNSRLPTTSDCNASLERQGVDRKPTEGSLKRPSSESNSSKITKKYTCTLQGVDMKKTTEKKQKTGLKMTASIGTSDTNIRKTFNDCSTQ